MTLWTDDAGTLHETCQLSFLIDGEDFGTVPFDPGSQAPGWRRTSYAWACQTCGEIWGRAILITSFNNVAPFEFFPVACRQHPDQWNVPGSLLSGPLGGLLEVLPPKAVRREFEIYNTR